MDICKIPSRHSNDAELSRKTHLIYTFVHNSMSQVQTERESADQDNEECLNCGNEVERITEVVVSKDGSLYHPICSDCSGSVVHITQGY